MADPVITLHDSGGTEIASALSLPTATPGTPTAETVFDVRNNDAAAASIDTASNVKLTVLGRLNGDSADPTNDGILYLAQRAAQVRVSAVSGGATAQVTGWRPIGNGTAFSLGEIPSGGIVTMGIRTSASLAAALAQVQLFVAVESIQSTPLPEGTYETHGNWIFDGRPGGKANPLFTALRSESGTWTINGPPDDSVNTPTRARYTLAGVPLTYAPTTASETFTNLDGDAAALLATEAYYAGLSYNASGTLTVTKGSKAVAPLDDTDKPTPPAGEIIRLWVVVPFGLAIDTIELVGEIGFFHLEVVSGLNVTVGPGIAAVGNRRVETQTSTSLTLADDSSLTIWRQPESGLEVIASTASPTDPWSMPLWDVVTASGAVTSTTDRRVIGLPGAGGADMSRFETLFGQDWNPNAELRQRVVHGNRLLDVSALTGTITTTANSKAVVGVGTAFTTELEVGGPLITDGGQVLRPQTLTDATNLVLTRNAAAAEAGVTAETAVFEEVKPFVASDAVYGDALSRRTATIHGGAPLTIEIASTNANDTSAGSGARTAVVTYIDATGAEVETAPLSLNGQTAVSVASGLAVNGVEVTSYGSNAAPEGDIYVGVGTFTAGVPADILAKVPQLAPGDDALVGFHPGRTAQAVFAVPSGWLAQVSGIQARADDTVELRVFVQRPSADGTLDGPISTLWSGYVTAAGLDLELSAPLAASIPAESYIFARAMTRSNGPAWVEVRVDVALLEV